MQKSLSTKLEIVSAILQLKALPYTTCDLYDACIGCGRCEESCPIKLPVHSFIMQAAEQTMLAEDNYCR
jgi:CO dehydrogenase/acetyl-CoA synthase alpha subunit